jgi:hypothetical protein
MELCTSRLLLLPHGVLVAIVAVAITISMYCQHIRMTHGERGTLQLQHTVALFCVVDHSPNCCGDGASRDLWWLIVRVLGDAVLLCTRELNDRGVGWYLHTAFITRIALIIIAIAAFLFVITGIATMA